MKYTIIDYKATDPVEIVSFNGFNSIEDIHTQEENVARVAIQGLSDVLSLGAPVLEAVAKFKGVPADAEAVWEAINPSPQRPVTPKTDVATPPKAKKISAKSRAKKATKGLPTDADTTTSTSVAGNTAGEGSKEINMATDKEKAAALKAKEKAKATAAKDKEKAAALKAKEAEKAAKAKEKEQGAKDKEKAKAAKAKEKEAAAKEKAKAKAAADKEKAAAKAARANGPKTPRGEKTLAVKKLLERKSGCTRAQVLEATGWPAVSMQAMAVNCGLKLKKEKVQGKPIVYFGS